MNNIVLLIVIIAIVLLIAGALVYLIGHAHGAKTTPPHVVIVGSGAGTGPAGPGSGTAQPGNNPQIKSDAT